MIKGNVVKQQKSNQKVQRDLYKLAQSDNLKQMIKRNKFSTDSNCNMYSPKNNKAYKPYQQSDKTKSQQFIQHLKTNQKDSSDTDQPKFFKAQTKSKKIQDNKNYYKKQAFASETKLKMLRKNDDDKKKIGDNVKNNDCQLTPQNKNKIRNFQPSKPMKNFFLQETLSSSAGQQKSNEVFKVPSFFSINNQKINKNDFKIISKLGEGKFGKVFLVRQIKTNFILAMKVIEKQKILQMNILEQFIRELKIQTFLNHNNIIKMYGFFHDQTNFYNLMELGCDGFLYKLIAQEKILSQQTTSYIIKSLLQATLYMHGQYVVHRDIKPQNIVMIHGTVKICDFGWAVNNKQSQLRTTYCGTPLYFSPELLSTQQYNDKADLWAIGVLAYELHIGRNPFSINLASQLTKIVTDQIIYPEELKVSFEFKQFIRCILEKNPQKRYTSKQLLSLKFISKYNQLQTCQQLCS